MRTFVHHSISLILAVSFALMASLAFAQETSPAQTPEPAWKAKLEAHAYGPPRLLAIDKDRQNVFLLEQKSPLSMVDNFSCSTGQVPGDKFEEGDLRTPEGIYFVESRLEGGMDFNLYGNLAFTLNYPNPVDRLKEKTGHGIWIHGRGHELTPRETKGCVAMNNQDMGTIDAVVKKGMPVVIAKDLHWADTFSKSDAPLKLKQSVEKWAKAWEAKSDSFFEYYDAPKFTKAQGEAFQGFKNHKAKLFNKLPWIQVMVDGVRVVAGPDYWVTYFGQFYRSPSLTSEGIKRLYWQEDENGEFRIVGKEWVTASLNLEEKYLENITHITALFLENWRNSWEAADINTYLSYYTPNAKQGNRKGLKGIGEHKKNLWGKKPPQAISMDDLEIRLHSKGIQVSFVQDYKAGRDYHDVGYKTLYLQPVGNSWQIVQEDWKAM